MKTTILTCDICKKEIKPGQGTPNHYIQIRDVSIEERTGIRYAMVDTPIIENQDICSMRCLKREYGRL